MDRMKTLAKYVVWIVLFYIFSNLMIYLNLESTYQNIGRKDNLPQVTVYQAQATKINGRIKGSIYNSEEHKITNKYLRIDLYSERDVFLGSKYIDVSTMRDDETRNFEEYFKVQDVDYYEIKFVDEKEEGELPEMLKDLTKEQVIWGTFLTFLIFWLKYRKRDYGDRTPILVFLFLNKNITKILQKYNIFVKNAKLQLKLLNYSFNYSIMEL